jgi:T5orf172 domain
MPYGQENSGCVSMVYFARMPSGLIKIGFTRNIARRLSELVGEYGTPIDIVGVLEGGRDEEQVIHERFSHVRTTGCEMFRECPEMFQFIREETIRISMRSGQKSRRRFRRIKPARKYK